MRYIDNEATNLKTEWRNQTRWPQEELLVYTPWLSTKYQIDNKMANNNHVIHFMYGLQYVLISLFYHDNLWLPEGHG